MRTTVNIEEGLLKEAKKRAIERDCTLGEVIGHALQESFRARPTNPSVEPTRLPTFGGRGLQAGVDLDSSASLLDLMDGR